MADIKIRGEEFLNKIYMQQIKQQQQHKKKTFIIYYDN